jgi:hypothetical protein
MKKRMACRKKRKNIKGPLRDWVVPFKSNRVFQLSLVMFLLTLPGIATDWITGNLLSMARYWFVAVPSPVI